MSELILTHNLNMKDYEFDNDSHSYYEVSDVYTLFVSEVIREVLVDSTDHRDNGVCVTLNEIYAEFKRWFGEHFPRSRVPLRSMVCHELSLMFGFPDENFNGLRWYGLRIVEREF